MSLLDTYIFQFKQFLENKIVAQFMNSKYSFILKNGALCFHTQSGLMRILHNTMSIKQTRARQQNTHADTLLKYLPEYTSE